MVTIVIHCQELPDPETMKRLGEMLQDGYTSGIGQPPGLTWKIETEKPEERR